MGSEIRAAHQLQEESTGSPVRPERTPERPVTPHEAGGPPENQSCKIWIPRTAYRYLVFFGSGRIKLRRKESMPESVYTLEPSSSAAAAQGRWTRLEKGYRKGGGVNRGEVTSLARWGP